MTEDEAKRLPSVLGLVDGRWIEVRYVQLPSMADYWEPCDHDWSDVYPEVDPTAFAPCPPKP